MSETKGGSSVSITDVGRGLYNISRYDYGRCFISNIVVERDWRNDTALTPNFAIVLTGGVIENITVINYECNIQAPKNYSGRPSSVNSLVVLEGGVNLEACNIGNSKFIRAKTGIIGGDININSYNNSRRVNANNILFNNVGVIIGNAVLMNSKLIDSYVQKNLFAENLFSKIINCYFENSRLNLQYLTLEKGMVIAKSVFENTTFNLNDNTVMYDNIDIS